MPSQPVWLYVLIRARGTEEGFCSINSEVVADVTNSPNFSAKSVGCHDMLLCGQIVRMCYVQIFCLQEKWNVSVS